MEGICEFVSSVLNEEGPFSLETIHPLTFQASSECLFQPEKRVRILLCMGGSVKLSSEGYEADLKPNDCLCIPTETECLLSSKKSTLLAIEVAVNTGGIPESYGVFLDRANILSGQSPSGMVSCCRELYREWNEALRNPSDFTRIAFKLSFARFLLFLHTFLLDADVRKKETEKNIVRHIEQHIQTHYVDKLSFEEMASSFGYSSRYLREVFKRHSGLTMVEYLTELRLKRACLLLQEGKNSITDVALDSGYMTVQYFSEVFKKRYGITPSEFRNHASEKYTEMVAIVS